MTRKSIPPALTAVVVAAGLAAAAAPKPSGDGWAAGQSIYWPTYIAEGTVYRSLSNRKDTVAFRDHFLLFICMDTE